MRKRANFNLVVVTVLGLLVLCNVALADELHVPDDYSTIQAAIDAASEGDEIIVSIGTYYENINFGGKNIILRSTDPANPTVVASTIIDGHQAGSVVTFSGTESPTCILAGFTITNGSGTGSMGATRGGGIYGNGTLATIQHNIVSGNRAVPYRFPGSGYGGGLYDCDGTIQFNIISGNKATCNEGGAGGGGLFSCDGTIQNNIISGNSASGFGGTAGGGLSNCNGTIQNNTVFGNSASSGGGLSGCNGTIINCIIWQNTANQGSQLYASSIPSYSCVQDWTDGGSGNISDNPQLVNPEGGDFHLQSTSPCIDVGAYIPDLTKDFEGDSRPRGSGYDIGADEFISDNSPPYTPTNISPANGATDVSLTPTLSASAFSDPDVRDTHQASQWHIWVSSTTTTVFALTKRSGDLSSVTIPSRTLSDNITYSWSVRYQNNQGAWSGWSRPTEFTTEETGEVITVPEDYSTIQDAIDCAIYGDEIIVSIGTYYENINFGGKNIILRSSDPTNPTVVASTIIDGHQAGSVVTFSGDEPPTCTFSGFTVTNGNGGGIAGNDTLATLQNNIITGNSAIYGGGITYCQGTIQNNTISGNSAEGPYAGQGGGLYRCHGTIQNNIITDNSSTAEGAGLTNCDGMIQNNTISNNSAGGSGGGGLLGCDGTIQNNIISGNSSSRHGGGFYQCNGTIQNNLICGNTAQGWGGGIYYSYGATIQNNTIYGNSAGTYGGGLSRCQYSGSTIRNCIVWGNTAGSDGAQVYLSGPITYCCIEGWTQDANGNIGANPNFVSPGDYHLQPDSPCINAGDPNYVAGPDERDLNGNPRIIGGRIDMGGYEFVPISKIAFASNRDGNYEIYVMNPDGSNQRRITYNDFDDRDPAWSPDGQKIAFSANRKPIGNYEIYVMNPNGTNQRRLTFNNGDDLDSAWSPDGSKIAFSSGGEIYVMNADGSQQIALTNDNFPDRYPAWSPDGSKIAFTRWGPALSDRGTIWLMSAQGELLGGPLTPAGEKEEHPSWSPDGSKIVYAGGWDSPEHLAIIDSTLRGPLDPFSTPVIITDEGFNREPDWSSALDLIAFSSDRAGNNDIWTISPTGDAATQLTNNPANDCEPSWSTKVISNKPPILDPIGDKTVREAETLKFFVTALDLDNDRVTMRAENLPEGAVFKPACTIPENPRAVYGFRWTPNYNQAGEYHVTFIASDGELSTSETITITVNNVNRPPVLDPIGNKTVDEGKTLEFKVTARDPDGDPIVLSAKPLPYGATFENNTFRWTPGFTQAGTYTVTFKAEEARALGLSATETITITVNNINGPPQIEPIGNKTVNRMKWLRFKVKATDPDADKISYYITNKPQGAHFNSRTGEFDWMPMIWQAGDFKVTFAVKDSKGNQSSETITITVPNSPPVLSPIGNKIVKAGQIIQFRLTAKDPDRIDQYMLRFGATNLPKGANLATNGVFTWRPSKLQTGTYKVQFYVRDPVGAIDDEAIIITVTK